MKECEISKPLNPDELQQAQKLMRYISGKIHDICVKHDIKYWLDWGSLLGAIRHGGHIPWDDDMDICMRRADYEKFLAVAQEELGEEFFVQHNGSDPNFPFVYAKVRLEGTCWISDHWKNANLKSYGVWVDIFPMDHMPKSRVMFRLVVLSRIFSKTIYHWYMNIYAVHPVKRMIQRLMVLVFPRKVTVKLMNLVIKSLSVFKRSGLRGMLCMNTARSVCRDCVFDELVLTKFEDREFFIPKNYDERLRGLYGDYMQLPPPEMRVNYHKILKLDFGKYKSL